MLTVKDNDIGTPEYDLPRIFDEGFIGDNGRLTHSHSTGMGLYLYKKLRTSLQIGLHVDSDQEGTVMSLEFSHV